MMLMVDMGNSALKWATFDQGLLNPQQRISYQDDNVLDDLLIGAWLRLSVPQSIWISNVAGPIKAKQVTDWVNRHWGLQPTFIKTSSYECGVQNGYKNPQQLGVDRWLALIGAHQLEKGRLCVVDCGTAVTLDVLSANGHHLGGLIMPGITTMRHQLLDSTYALTHLNKTNLSNHEKLLLADNTQTGIMKGTSYAVIGLLEYVISTLDSPGDSLKLILTGGSTPVLESLLQRPSRSVPDLVLLGLVAVVNQSL
jgi:type III pantothenate kinase